MGATRRIGHLLLWLAIKLSTARLVFDSNRHNLERMPYSYPLTGYDL